MWRVEGTIFSGRFSGRGSRKPWTRRAGTGGRTSARRRRRRRRQRCRRSACPQDRHPPPPPLSPAQSPAARRPPSRRRRSPPCPPQRSPPSTPDAAARARRNAAVGERASAARTHLPSTASAGADERWSVLMTDGRGCRAQLVKMNVHFIQHNSNELRPTVLQTKQHTHTHTHRGVFHITYSSMQTMQL